MDVTEHISSLRAWMRENGFDLLVTPKADPHHVEWLRPEANLVQRFSGFGGSYGKLVVGRERAILMTSGIYAEAAEKQLGPLGFDIVDDSSVPLDAWLKATLSPGDRVGIDPWLHSATDYAALAASIKAGGAFLIDLTVNPFAEIASAPVITICQVTAHPPQFAGESSAQKRERMAAQIGAIPADAALLSAPDSICWLLNIRGRDVFDTPLVYAFALLRHDGSAALYIDLEKITADIRQHLGSAVEILPYAAIGDVFRHDSRIKTVAMDFDTTSRAFIDLAAESGVAATNAVDPCQLAKCIKNPVEREGAVAAHVRDGVAQVRFWRWWSERVAHGNGPDEADAEYRIDGLRAEMEYHRGVSFRTISAAGPHASMPHYHSDLSATEPLIADNFFLLDSGGQYLDGTTDVTRTFAVGTPSMEMKLRYTQVLKGLIAANGARFPRGTRGYMIDAFARQPLWIDGLDYPHGTGHGVGSFLGVHEYPLRLRAKPDPTPLVPGMITSVEPGFYAAGRFGIRHENLVLVEADEDEPDSPYLRFRTLTLCPFDLSPILWERLSAEEVGWIDAYHAQVRGMLALLLDGEDLDWLMERTAPVAEQLSALSNVAA